jgi:hypothetical protein
MKKLALFLILASFANAYDLGFDFIVRGEKSKIEETMSQTGRMLIEKKDKDYNFNGEILLNENVSEIDIAKLDIYMPHSTLSLGKMRIGWGAGQNFQAEDIFNFISLDSAIDPFYIKKGRESISFTSYKFKNHPLEFVYAFAQEYKGKDFGIKQKIYQGNFELELAYIKKGVEIFDDIDFVRVEDKLICLNYMSSTFMNIGLWTELVYSKEKSNIGGSFGFDRYFKENFYFNIEYYRSLYGESKKEVYNFDLNYITGEPVAKNYIIPSISYEVDEKWTHNVFSFYNVDDSSFILGENTRYFYNDYITFNLVLTYFDGKSKSEYGYIKDNIGDFLIYGSIRVQL